MVDAPRFLGVDRGVARTPADVTSRPRSVADFAPADTDRPWRDMFSMPVGDHRNFVVEVTDGDSALANAYWTGRFWAHAPVSAAPIAISFSPLAWRRAKTVSRPWRSASDFAGRTYSTPIEKQLGRLGFALGKAAIVEQMIIAAQVYRANGQTESAAAIESLVQLSAPLELDISLLDPRL